MAIRKKKTTKSVAKEPAKPKASERDTVEIEIPKENKSDPQHENVPAVEAKTPKPEPKALTVENIMAHEKCSEKVATAIHSAQLALERERNIEAFAKSRKTNAHYLCRSARSQGYWKAGRKFGPGETIVFLDELSESQVVEMETANPVHLKVIKVGFPETSQDDEAQADG